MEALTLMQGAFDLLLGITLLWLAWRALTSQELFKSIVLYIAFGLLMALVWARLEAPDVALAEAAIGAGLTGALLLNALGQLRDMGVITQDDEQDKPSLQTISNDDINRKEES